MKKIHLINDTYQIHTDNDETIMFQGSSDECDEFMLKEFLDYILSKPELLAVFKTLADK